MRKVLIASTIVLAACGMEPLAQEGTPPGAEGGQQVNAAAYHQVQANLTQLGLTQDDRLVQRVSFTDQLGQTHTRFDRYYRGLRVLGGDLVVHEQGTALRGFSATLKAPIGVSQYATLAQAEAVLRGAAAFRGAADGDSRSELVIYAYEGHGADGGAPVLAYDVVTTGTAPDGTPSVLHAYVDAHSGAVLATEDEIETAAAVGVGKSLYAGTVPINTNSTGSKFETRDMVHGGAVTQDQSGLFGQIFTSTDDTFGDSTNGNKATAGVDASYGGAMTFDYYKTVHGRNGIADDGKGGRSRVHYGNKYNNAFWSDGCFCMTYGDGDGKMFTPFVALDVTGHEMTHGVTSHTAGLSGAGQSGALNESTSDVFGTAVEFFANNAKEPGNYLMGEVITLNLNGHKFIRSMSDPKSDGKSIDHLSLYTSGIDVHLAGGISNNAFYLLSEGGTNHTSGIAVTGIGRAKAEMIWYRALTVYFTSGTTFTAAATACVKAAGDLYGAGSAEQNAVVSAWHAVGAG